MFLTRNRTFPGLTWWVLSVTPCAPSGLFQSSASTIVGLAAKAGFASKQSNSAVDEVDKYEVVDIEASFRVLRSREVVVAASKLPVGQGAMNSRDSQRPGE